MKPLKSMSKNRPLNCDSNTNMNYLLEGQKTERLLFRKIKPTDFDQWLPFHQDRNTSKHWHSDLKSPEIECKQWFEKQFYRYQNNLGGMNALIERKSGLLVGQSGLLVQEIDGKTELEIGYSLLPKFWAKGFAIEAAKKCRDFAFEKNLSDSVVSIISLSNTPSIRVAIKIDMQLNSTTDYANNRVNIFKINRRQWLNSKVFAI